MRQGKHSTNEATASECKHIRRMTERGRVHRDLSRKELVIQENMPGKISIAFFQPCLLIFFSSLKNEQPSSSLRVNKQGANLEFGQQILSLPLQTTHEFGITLFCCNL